MKNSVALFTILLLSVFCSACINNVAVLKLNDKAKEYMDEGDIKSAISRLESSVDLDGNIFESRYNLAVAYMDANMCDKALTQINEAQKLLKKDEAAVFYIKGLANSCQADNSIKEADSQGNLIVNKELLAKPEIAAKYVSYLKDSNNAFQKYTDLAPNTEQTRDIISKINDNNIEINKYSIEQ